jgi:C-terminal processing protease CtpA/Prc
LGIGFIAVAEGAYIGAVERGNAGERAGVRVGMTISQINGQSMKNKTQDEVGQMLRQASGTIILTMSDGLQFQMEKATPE